MSDLSRRQMFLKLGAAFNGARRSASRDSDRGISSFAADSRREMGATIRWISLGSTDQFPAGPDAACGCIATQSRCGESYGWRDGRDPMLGAQHRREQFSGIRDQLRASRMPGAMVSAIAPVHVPLPRRSLLRGRLHARRVARSEACSNMRLRSSMELFTSKRASCKHTRPFRREHIADTDKGGSAHAPDS